MTIRRRRQLALSCLALPVLAAALWLALPRIAHDLIASELRARGFEDASLRVGRIGWGTIVLEDVRLGPDLAIDEVRAGLDLSRGTIETLTLVGARLDVEPSPEALRSSSLSRLLGDAGGAGDGQDAPHRIRLDHAQVSVAGLDPIEVDGELSPRDGRARLTVRSPLGEHRVVARTDAEGEHTTLTVTARSSSDGARATVRWAPSGSVAIAARADLGAGERGSGEHTLRLERGRLDAHARIEEARLRELEVHAGAAGLSIDQLPVGDVELSASRDGEAIAWSASVDAKADLSAAIGGRAPTELGRWSDPGPIEWEITGPIEGALLARALPGVELEADPRVALTGTLRRDGTAWALDAIDGTVEAPSLQVPGGDTSLAGLQARVRARASIGESVSVAIEEGTTVRADRLDIDELHSRSIELSPELRIEARGSAVRLSVDRDVVADMDRLSIGSGNAALHFDRTRMTLAAVDGEPIVDTARDVHVQMRLDADSERVAGLLRGRRAEGGGELTVTMHPGGADITLPLEVRAAALEQSEAELTLRAARVALPLVWERGELASEGRMRARSMAWRGIAIGATSGAVRITPDDVRLAWRGPATESADFRMRASFPFSEGSGSVHIAVPRTVVAEDDPLARVLAELTDMNITGAIEGELHLDVDAPERGRARIALHGADVEEVDESSRARGVRGTIRLASLDPLVSRAPARATWTALTIGDFVDTDAGSATLAFLPSGDVSIDGFDAHVAGGRVRAAPFSFDWDEPDVSLALRIDGIELGRVAQALSKGRVRATGRLDGHVALRVRAGERPRVVLGDGRLTSRGAGTIRIGEGRAEDFDTTNLDVLLEGDWLEQRLASALSDFRYERLILVLDDPGGTRRLRARVVGRGRRTPQELDLTLNVRGVQPLIDNALRLWPDGRAFAQIETSRR